MINLNNPSVPFSTLSQIMTVLNLCHRCVVAMERQRPCRSLRYSSTNVITTTAVAGLLILYISSPSLFHFIFSYLVRELERETDETCLHIQSFVRVLNSHLKKRRS